MPATKEYTGSEWTVLESSCVQTKDSMKPRKLAATACDQIKPNKQFQISNCDEAKH